MPFENQIELAWAASLVLVLIVLVFNILSRLVGQRRSREPRGKTTMNAMSDDCSRAPEPTSGDGPSRPGRTAPS